MKVADYKCNLCGESLIHLEELIGIKLDSDSEFRPRPLEQADTHICEQCLIAIENFAKKWKGKDEMTPAEKHGWGLCW